jgi:hypothetical protein
MNSVPLKQVATDTEHPHQTIAALALLDYKASIMHLIKILEQLMLADGKTFSSDREHSDQAITHARLRKRLEETLTISPNPSGQK